MSQPFKLPAEFIDGFTKEMEDRFAYTLDTIHTKIVCYSDREGGSFLRPTKPFTEWPAIMVFEDGTVMDAILYLHGIDPVRKWPPEHVDHWLNKPIPDNRPA